MKRAYLLLYCIVAIVFTDNVNAQTWTQAGTGVNALNANNAVNGLVVDKAGNVYAGGGFYTEDNATGSIYYGIAKYDGTTWKSLLAGLPGSILTMAIDKADNVYCAGYYSNVGKWNGHVFTGLGTGKNGLNANGTVNTIVVDTMGNVYAAGAFQNTSRKYYVAKWNGRSWIELGSGANALNATAAITSITNDKAGNVYATGGFISNGNYYVARWNGTHWSNIGPANSCDKINSMVTDRAGNLYVAGNFKNTQGKCKDCVAKWDGSNWTELDTETPTLNANKSINTLIIDTEDNIYAAGNFDAGGLNAPRYVAKWNGSSWTRIGQSAMTAVINAIVKAANGKLMPLVKAPKCTWWSNTTGASVPA